MDDRRFDDLVRSLSIRLPRRGLGPLAGGLLATLGIPDADAGERHSRRRNEPKREDRSDPGLDARIDAAGPDAAKKKKKKKKKKKPPTCGNFGAYCYSSYGCCGSLYCYDSRCAYSGTNPCPDDQYDCGATCSWSSACCPTGQKLCDGVCVASTACCPACGAGQTCVNGACTGGGSAGCPAGMTECDGACLSPGSCCPLCEIDQYCDAGTCKSLGCDSVELDACLADVATRMGETRATCQQSCTNPSSDECLKCVWRWLLGPDVSLLTCHAVACSGAGTSSFADQERVVAVGSDCNLGNYHACILDAYDDVEANIVSDWVPGGFLAGIAGCLGGPATCGLLAAIAGGAVLSDVGAGVKFLYDIAKCEKPDNLGVLRGCGSSPAPFKYCVAGNKCCHRPTYAFHAGTCCQPNGICGAVCCANLNQECRNGQCVRTCPQGTRAVGDECCLPQCTGKCGGDDGCGGTCPNTCTAPAACNAATNTCCTPNCGGKCGGDDGCGGTCPDTCTNGRICDPPGYFSCVCPSGVSLGDGCCPEGTVRLCPWYLEAPVCCDWPECEMSGAEVRVAGCCTAVRRYTDAQGNKGCCPIWQHARGDGCCDLPGVFNPGYRPELCCSGEMGVGPYCG